MRLVSNVTATFFGVIVTFQAFAQLESGNADIEDAIWALEDAYWRYAKAGDASSYLSLWHADFVGWTCGGLDPSRKANIGDWVQVIRDEGLELVYEIERREIQLFGNVAVVHYVTPVERIYPDNSVHWQGELFKFTHTWMRVGDQWQIIGGMCGELGAPD